MSCIYQNQSLKIESTITIDGAAPTDPITAAVYRYWIPGNNTAINDGEWTATILDGAAGTIEYQIPENILTTSGIWKTQTIATSGGLTYPACMDTFTIKALGS